MKTLLMSALLPLFSLVSSNCFAEIIDVTKMMTHFECRARGKDADPYYLETKERRNPGDPKGMLSLLWSYNSIFNSKPIAYYTITSVVYDTERRLYSMKFFFNNPQTKMGLLTFENGGGGEAEFYNTNGNPVYHSLSRCAITGQW